MKEGVETQISEELEQVIAADELLTTQYQHWLVLQPALNRALVSFQANKGKAVYRWYKYKEGFSADMVTYFLNQLHLPAATRLFDPFAGSGTALFVAAEREMEAEGIELLPIGQALIEARQVVETGLQPAELDALRWWRTTGPWRTADPLPVPALRITAGAYPAETEQHIGGYLAALAHETPRMQTLLRFALLCVLENVSFTRKDGQYLRWDHRSARKQGKRPFNKGVIPTFDHAMQGKLVEMLGDLIDPPALGGLFDAPAPALHPGPVSLLAGSCLDWLPRLETASYDCIITSPPYCNRYDYTRTYALELALLGVDEKQLSALRQAMLSCTVENRPKELRDLHPAWAAALTAAEEQVLLQRLLAYLEAERKAGRLNNPGIARMVKGYFYELACVIQECFRIMRPGTMLFMVNDNVRYAGANVSVDLILSDIAQQLGFEITAIWVLPGNKGNSSQQMGLHGREPLRKCVYQWRKP